MTGYSRRRIGVPDAVQMLNEPSPDGRPNSDGLRPGVNGSAVVRVPENKWIIDLGVRINESNEQVYAQRDAVAGAAKHLDGLRASWLNPSEWTRTEVLEFPGSADGPWKRYVHAPDAGGVGTVKSPRTVPKGGRRGRRRLIRNPADR